jgi:hypothetical protein
MERLRIYFSGIDGAGKTRCMYGLIERLSPLNPILRIGTTGLLIYEAGKSTHLIDSRRMQSIGSKVRGTPLYGVWLVCHFLFKIVASKYYSWSADYRVAMFESDMLINPSAYLSFHFPALCRVLSPSTRFRLIHTFFGSRRGTFILHLDVDPAVGVARCKARTDEDGCETDPHENLEDLTYLRAQIEQITQAASVAGYDLVTLDTSSLTIDQMIDAAEAEIRKRVTLSAS